jgi:hypothetical protein
MAGPAKHQHKYELKCDPILDRRRHCPWPVMTGLQDCEESECESICLEGPLTGGRRVLSHRCPLTPGGPTSFAALAQAALAGCAKVARLADS